jgi:hypothetical protein
MRDVMLDLRNSATLAIKEKMIFWNKARIATREPRRRIEKIEALYKERRKQLPICWFLLKSFLRP